MIVTIIEQFIVSVFRSSCVQYWKYTVLTTHYFIATIVQNVHIPILNFFVTSDTISELMGEKKKKKKKKEKKNKNFHKNRNRVN